MSILKGWTSAWGALLSGVFVLAACLPTEVCGCTPQLPVAGWARVEGTVTRATGVPYAHAEVVVTKCESPIGGLAGEGRTSASGAYQVWAKLLDPGLPVPPEGLTVSCTVVAGRGFAEAPARLTFVSKKEDVVPLTVNLVEKAKG